MKISGKEWKLFNADPKAFPPDSYYEDESILINGEVTDDVPDDLKDADVITLKGGVYFRSASDREGVNLESHFRRWRKQQAGRTYCVFIPAGKETKVRLALKRLGIKLQA